MAFSFLKWLFGSRDSPTEVTGEEFFDIYSDAYIRELAFHACVNLVGNAISKCEIKTYAGGRETKGPEYYLWNYAPNQNQNSAAFLHKLIYQLYKERTALVVENGGKLYVADSFSRKEYALYDDLFSQVAVGDFTFARTFARSEVLFFELASMDARRIADGLYTSYGKLIQYGMNGYQKSRGQHGTLELDTSAAGDAKFNAALEEIKNKGFSTFANADNAILPLYKGMKYTDLSQKTYNSDTTRDIRAMIDDVTDFYARGYGIPPSLLDGSVQDVSVATDQLLTFCIDPIADLLEEEIIRQRYGYDGMARGDLLHIDTSRVRHIDVLKEAVNIDKLISSGAESVNDVRDLLKQARISEPWADQHFITKNYGTVADVLAAANGGENK